VSGPRTQKTLRHGAGSGDLIQIEAISHRAGDDPDLMFDAGIDNWRIGAGATMCPR
jgi:hypothetical protein